MHTDLDEAIIHIVSRIKYGRLFDTHYVISLLKIKHFGVYTKYHGLYKINYFHGLIGKKIKSLHKRKVELLGTSVSLDVNGNESTSAVWIKKAK